MACGCTSVKAVLLGCGSAASWLRFRGNQRKMTIRRQEGSPWDVECPATPPEKMVPRPLISSRPPPPPELPTFAEAQPGVGFDFRERVLWVGKARMEEVPRLARRARADRRRSQEGPGGLTFSRAGRGHTPCLTGVGACR